MLAKAGTVIAALAAIAAAAPLQHVAECITDVKILACTDIDCQLDGYHRIDSGLTQRDNATSWNYVVYKTEQAPLSHCITDLDVVAENGRSPGAGWTQADGTAHAGVTKSGGPSIYYERNPALQASGRVVDWIIAKPGRWANATGDFERTFVNLGLGEAAGSAAAEDWRLYNYISSGWVWLMYSHAGERLPITDVQVVACGGTTVATDCGLDLVKQGWERRDVDINGPTVNGSHIFLFTTTEPQRDEKCVVHLGAADTAGGADTLATNLNNATNGTAVYLSAVRSNHGECLTSVVVQAVGYYTDLPSHEPVTYPNGTVADFNAGIDPSALSIADEIYILTSTRKHLAIPETPALSFRADGTFRVAHFSDLHTMQQEYLCLNMPDFIAGNCSELFASAFMARALNETDPDLVVINGDLFSEDQRRVDGQTFPLQAMASVMKVLGPIVDRGLPWAVTYGNHDSEGDATQEELMRIFANVPGFIGRRGRADLQGIGNYELSVTTGVDETTDALRLWFFDSHPASPTGDGLTTFEWEDDGSTGANGAAYGKIQPRQIEWYKDESARLNAVQQANAVAFYHIPVPEMALAWQDETRARNLSGTHVEPLCTQGKGCDDWVNVTANPVGLLEAFHATGDVKATFSGHDHETDVSAFILFEANGTDGLWMTCDGNSGYGGYSSGADGYNREMRFILFTDVGAHAQTYKVIDDVFAGTVHRNTSEPIVQLF